MVHSQARRLARGRTLHCEAGCTVIANHSVSSCLSSAEGLLAGTVPLQLCWSCMHGDPEPVQHSGLVLLLPSCGTWGKLPSPSLNLRYLSEKHNCSEAFLCFKHQVGTGTEPDSPRIFVTLWLLHVLDRGKQRLSSVHEVQAPRQKTQLASIFLRVNIFQVGFPHVWALLHGLFWRIAGEEAANHRPPAPASASWR